MHVEISRMITAWLEHKEYGVNTLLASVPRKNLSGKDDRKPQAVKVYNDVDFNIAGVVGIDPPELPSIVVVSDMDIRNAQVVQPKQPGVSYTAVVGVGYYADEDDKSLVVKDGNYVLRAVMRSLKMFDDSPDRSKAYRELNKIQLTRMTGLTQQRIGGAVPQSRLLGLVFADFTVLDKAPVAL